MAISTPVEWDTTMDATPSTSTSTSSNAYTADSLYIVFVTQYRTDSTNPPAPSVSGFGATWTDITPDLGGLSAPGLWDDSSGSRRRLSVFKGIPGSSGTGALTVSYASNPGNCGVIVWELAGADDVVAFAEGDVGGSAGVSRGVSFAGAADSSDNVTLAVVACNTTNVAATARLELNTDSGGDVDWTTGTVVTDSNPATTFFSGYYAGDPDDDRDPTWYQNGGFTTAYMFALEVQAAAPPASTFRAFWGILVPMGVAFVAAGLGVAPLGTAPLGH